MASWRVGGVDAGLVDQLAGELSGSALGSLLLEVMRRRAASRRPADLMAQHRRDPLVAPAGDLRVALAVDAALLDAAEADRAVVAGPSTKRKTDQEIENEKITWLRIMCSGFRPIDNAVD